MTKDTKTPIVRLAGSGVASAANKTSGERGQIIKLAIRLNETVNETLRSMIRYRGDLSRFAIEALEQIDVRSVPLISTDEPLVPDTTISLPRSLHKKMRALSKDRSASMNILVSTALGHWLAKQGKLKLE